MICIEYYYVGYNRQVYCNENINQHTHETILSQF